MSIVRGNLAGVVPTGASASSTKRKKCHANLAGDEPSLVESEFSFDDVDMDAWLVSGSFVLLVKSLSRKG